MSVSLSLGSDEEIPLVWDDYSMDPDVDRTRLLHCKRKDAQERYKLQRMGQLFKYVETNSVNQMEVMVAMEQSITGNRSFGIQTIDALHTAFVRQHPIFGHEIIRKCKAYFDLDLIVGPADLTERGRETILRRFINYLSEKAGFDSDWDDWVILVCPYTDHPTKANKFSAHLIYQDLWFKGPEVLKAWLDTRIDWNHVATEFGCDSQVYKTNQTLRLPGGSRFVALTDRRAPLANPEPCYPLLFFNPRKHCTDVLFSDYTRALVTSIPARCQEMTVEGGTQMIERGLHQPAAYDGTMPGKVIHFLRKAGEEWDLNLDLDYMRISMADDSNPTFQTQEQFTFHLHGYDGFQMCNHASEDILCTMYPQCDCFVLDCPECGPLWAGLTLQSQRFVRDLEFLNFLDGFKLARPDFCFPGGARAPGHFAMSDIEFYQRIRGTRRAEYQAGQFVPPDAYLAWLMDEDDRTAIPIAKDGNPLPAPFIHSGGGVFNPEMIHWLDRLMPPGDSGISRELVAYINCFAACVGKTYYLIGVGEKTKMQMQEFMARLKCAKWSRPKPTKKSPDPDWVKGTRPIFDVWKEHDRRATFKCFVVSSLDFSLQSQMNALPPVAYDLNECLAAYDALDDGMTTMLRESFKKLVEMYVYTEPDPAVKAEMVHTFYRFYHSAIFEFDKRAPLAIALVSTDEGGQGKSWGGEMIGKILGAEYYRSFDGATWNADKFDACNGLNVLNELEFKQKSDASQLKARITADAFSDRKMFKSAVRVENLSRFWIAVNFMNLEGLAQPGMERRLMVAELLDVDIYDGKQLFEYECVHCLGADGECNHSFHSHMDLMALLRDEIFPYPERVSAYVGMLYRFFDSLERREPEKWARPLGTFCPQTKAGATLRKANQSSPEAFFLAAVERGSHFHAKYQPPINSGFKTVYLTKGQTERLTDDKVNMDKPPGWEEKVAEDSLYHAYRWFCQETGLHSVKMSEFNEELKKFYRQRVERGKNPECDMKEVYQHEWKKSDTGSLKWVPATNPAVKKKVWVMGKTWGDRMRKLDTERLAVRGQAKLNKSRSALFTNSFNARSPEPIARIDIPEYPRHVPTSSSVWEIDSQPGEYLGQLSDLINSDAQDGFDVGFARCDEIDEPLEISDEASQDRRARFHDSRPQKRNKFIDDEVIVDDEEEEVNSDEERMIRELY